MGLPLLFAFQEPWFHLSELQLPVPHLLTLLSPVAILVFSCPPQAVPLNASGAVVACSVLSNLAHMALHSMGPWHIASTVLKAVPVCQ